MCKGDENLMIDLPNAVAIQDGITAFRRWVSKTLVPNGRTFHENGGKDKRPASDSKDAPMAKRQKSDEAIKSTSKPGSLNNVKPDASSFGKGTGVSAGRVLPDFKKGASTPVPPPPPVQSSSTSLLASTLAKLKNSVDTKPSIGGINANSAFNPRPTLTKPVKLPNKKGFNIRFRDDEGKGEIEVVRFFKEEEWEFERPFWIPETGEDSVVSHMKEGSFMNVHKELEEEIDWFEPLRESLHF